MGTKECFQDCKVSQWSGFSKCTKACGGGTQNRSRKVEAKAKGRLGITCPILTEKRRCNTKGCLIPVNCKVSPWREFTSCSKPCGRGTQVRARRVLIEPEDGGRTCPKLRETRACNTQGCPK